MNDLPLEVKARYNAKYGLPPGACNCHHGSARYCPVHTQADYDAHDAEVLHNFSHRWKCIDCEAARVEQGAGLTDRAASLIIGATQAERGIARDDLIEYVPLLQEAMQETAEQLTTGRVYVSRDNAMSLLLALGRRGLGLISDRATPTPAETPE